MPVCLVVHGDDKNVKGGGPADPTVVLRVFLFHGAVSTIPILYLYLLTFFNFQISYVRYR